MEDIEYMRLAISLARKGSGWVNPNPMVGAVVVKDGLILGKGYHHKYGGLHAEREALADCGAPVAGATLYVTLEPCCHYGKTPPCTNAIIKSGISRVVIGSSDPNPLVAGKGIKQLRDNGIEVTENVALEECIRLNESFFYFIREKEPFVVMKYAMTMDGKMATNSGRSRWITCEQARMRVHEDRHSNSAIMTGVGTVLADDPMMNCRLENAKNPTRIICDTRFRTPITSNIVTTAHTIPTIIATSDKSYDKHRIYTDAGCEVIVIPEKSGHIDLNILMKKLGEKNIDSILLEGGGQLNWSALQSGIVNKLQVYIAPKLFGGMGMTPIAGSGIEDPKDAFRLSSPHITRIGDDILIESEVLQCSQD